MCFVLALNRFELMPVSTHGANVDSYSFSVLFFLINKQRFRKDKLYDIESPRSFVLRGEERGGARDFRPGRNTEHCGAFVAVCHRSTGIDRELLLRIIDGPLKVTSVWAIWACCLACPACLSDLHLTAPAKYIQ